jgi:hypothetical protein
MRQQVFDRRAQGRRCRQRSLNAVNSWLVLALSGFWVGAGVAARLAGLHLDLHAGAFEPPLRQFVDQRWRHLAQLGRHCAIAGVNHHDRDL